MVSAPSTGTAAVAQAMPSPVAGTFATSQSSSLSGARIDRRVLAGAAAGGRLRRRCLRELDHLAGEVGAEGGDEHHRVMEAHVEPIRRRPRQPAQPPAPGMRGDERVAEVGRAQAHQRRQRVVHHQSAVPAPQLQQRLGLQRARIDQHGGAATGAGQFPGLCQFRERLARAGGAVEHLRRPQVRHGLGAAIAGATAVRGGLAAQLHDHIRVRHMPDVPQNAQQAPPHLGRRLLGVKRLAASHSDAGSRVLLSSSMCWACARRKRSRAASGVRASPTRASPASACCTTSRGRRRGLYCSARAA